MRLISIKASVCDGRLALRARCPRDGRQAAVFRWSIESCTGRRVGRPLTPVSVAGVARTNEHARRVLGESGGRRGSSTVWGGPDMRSVLLVERGPILRELYLRAAKSRSRRS